MDELMRGLRRIFLKHEPTIAIGTFNRAVGAKIEVDPRVPKRAAIAVAGDDVFLDLEGFRGTRDIRSIWRHCHNASNSSEASTLASRR